jgi:hypothetical protein
MANFGVHTAIISKEKTLEDGVSTKTVYGYIAHVGSNPYYWVKVQKPRQVKLPDYVVNPTYSKITNLVEGE